MTLPATVITERFREMLDAAGLSQSALARKIGVSQATIGKLALGVSGGSKHLHAIARELGTTPAYLTGETDDPHEGALPVPSAETLAEQLDLVEVQELDLKFGMGATDLEIPVTSSTRHFSRTWIRQYTNASAEHLYFAQGIGDSMAPTINDHDLILVDTSERNIRIGDKIWACAYSGQGMIKRLRNKGEGVQILSDNPLVPPDIAYDGELHILGRVVGIFRKM
jgi:phage repressor protein C with HTH and peptisase S24 domain